MYFHGYLIKRENQFKLVHLVQNIQNNSKEKHKPRLQILMTRFGNQIFLYSKITESLTNVYGH